MNGPNIYNKDQLEVLINFIKDFKYFKNFKCLKII